MNLLNYVDIERMMKMIKQDKQDFIYNVETLATGNDKEKLYDEILKLKNEKGFTLLEILSALKEYDNPKFEEQRNEILTINCDKKILKVELLVYDFGDIHNELDNYYSKDKISDGLKKMESDRFKVKDVLNIINYSDSLKNLK